MIRTNGLITFSAEENNNTYYSQRNNEISWPPKEEYPNAQYIVNWKNVCNTTSIVGALSIAGWKFPQGKYKQPEDNLTYFILNNEQIREAYKKNQPAMYDVWMKSLMGQCNKQDLVNVYPPNEIHQYLCWGTNLWLGTTAVKFSTDQDFVKALWRDMVYDNLPIVISTRFGGLGHIVCVTGVSFDEQEYDNYCNNENNELPIPVEIIVDDPWGKVDTVKNVYIPNESGNDVHIPWDFVVENVKPCNSTRVKWMHRFKHGIETV